MVMAAGALVLRAGGPVVARFAAKAGGMQFLRGLAQAGARTTRGGVGGWLVPNARIPGPLRTVATFFGLSALADWFIPGDIFPDLWGTVGALSGGGGGVAHPFPVQKSWTANGVQMVKMVMPNGRTRMGARKKDGTWSYWTPKRPIVLYPGGSTSLKVLLRADRTTETQLKKVKKVIDRRFPRRQRSSSRRADGGTVIISESGPGGVRA